MDTSADDAAKRILIASPQTALSLVDDSASLRLRRFAASAGDAPRALLAELRATG